METAKSENTGERVRIFPVQWERAVLLLGLVPLAFAVWDPGWFKERWKLQLVSDLLFLNVVHNAFSFYIMWRSPEIRQAIREHTSGHPWRLHLRAATVFAVGFALYFLFSKKMVSNQLFYIVSITAVEYLALQHAMSQAFGLSRLYDHRLSQNFNLTPAQLHRVASAAKLERIFHRIALAGIAARAGVWAARIDGQSEAWGFWLHTSRALMIVGTLGLMATHFARPHWRRSNQWIFGLRRAWELIPSFFNPAYIAFQRLNHGFEYLAVTASIERNSRRHRSRTIAGAVFLGLVSIRGFVYLHQVFQSHLPADGGDFAAVPLNSFAFTGPLAEVTTFLALTSLSISLTHYYYDSQIFQFSRSAFRDGVLPLIAPSRNSKP
jgi:hypothetical protein